MGINSSLHWFYYILNVIQFWTFKINCKEREAVLILFFDMLCGNDEETNETMSLIYIYVWCYRVSLNTHDKRILRRNFHRSLNPKF